MKNSAEYASRIKKLLNRIKKNYKDLAPTPLSTDPIEALILGCLSTDATESKALTALKKIRSHFVDFNELRVARIFEIDQILGKSFPESRAIAVTIKKLLNSIYDSYDQLNLDHLAEMGKRDAKAALEEIDGMNPYLVAWIMMTCLGGHSFPVNQKMVDVLLAEEAINPKSDVHDVQGFLERQINATELIESFTLLRHYCDHGEKNVKPVNGAPKTKTKKTSPKTKTTEPRQKKTTQKKSSPK